MAAPLFSRCARPSSATAAGRIPKWRTWSSSSRSTTWTETAGDLAEVSWVHLGFGLWFSERFFGFPPGSKQHSPYWFTGNDAVLWIKMPSVHVFLWSLWPSPMLPGYLNLFQNCLPSTSKLDDTPIEKSPIRSKRLLFLFCHQNIAILQTSGPGSTRRNSYSLSLGVWTVDVAHLEIVWSMQRDWCRSWGNHLQPNFP